MDPHTGAVLALVGGRNYGFSQLNHARREAAHRLHFQAVRLCRRHEYRAGWLASGDHAGVDVTDAPTTFAYGDQIYEPRNYKEEYHGDVTAALCAGDVAEQRDRETGGRSRLRQSCGPGQVRRHHSVKADARHGAGLLRRHAARYGRGLHRLCQRRRAPFADPGELRAQCQGRRGGELQTRPAPGAGSPRSPTS